jgi:hypothetical protein
VRAWIDSHKEEIDSRADENKKVKFVWVLEDGEFKKIPNPHLEADARV